MFISRPGIILLLCCCGFRIAAQEYHPVARSKDAFSQALVNTLHCAADYFKSCKGDSLQYTVLQELEHRLTFHFPGSAAAIVRERNYDRNAYIEFRGYPDTQSLKKGVKDLVSKIRKALGDQLYEDESINKLFSLYYTSFSLSVKDANGFFSPNMEIMVSSSSSVYLLPGKQDNGPKEFFILLKIYGRIPGYNYFIPADTKSPDPVMSKVIHQVWKDAPNDFTNLFRPAPDSSFFNRRKRADTTVIDGITVIRSRRGSNHSVYIDISSKNLSADSSLLRALLMVKSALGPLYVYTSSSYLGRSMYNFYVPNSNGKKASVYLERDKLDKEDHIYVRVLSTIWHPLKRSANFSNDFDEDW